MDEHEGWRDKICDAAVKLMEAGGGGKNSYVQFCWALLYLCLAVCPLISASSVLKECEIFGPFMALTAENSFAGEKGICCSLSHEKERGGPQQSLSASGEH